MSKRDPNRSHIRAFASARIIVALLLTTFISGIALAAQPSISIERPRDVIQGSFEYVDVKYEANISSLQFAGFDLLISYDAAALTLIDATQGNLLNDCGWQYFTYRVGNDACTGSCPSSVVRIVALGDSPQVSGQQSCNLGASSGNLATIKFLVTNDASFECITVPVQFYWSDCGDNVLSSVTGNTLFVADTVYYGFASDLIYPVPNGLQTNQGWPESCASELGNNQANRAVNFREGGVSIVCPEPIDYRGDINLNALAYEVADAILFSDYFFAGLAAFTTDVNAQVDATDVNANGLPLEFRDLIYLLRIILGDALPFPKAPAVDTLTAVFTQNTLSKFVRVESPHLLAGAILDFDGQITPDYLPAAPDNFFQESMNLAGGTRILVASGQPGQATNGIWFSYTGDAALVSVTTADFADSPIEAQIAFETAPANCGDVNNDRHTNISDAVSLINYIFDVFPSQIDPYASDVDCDRMISISDAVYLINYIFAGGTAPCAACN